MGIFSEILKTLGLTNTNKKVTISNNVTKKEMIPMATQIPHEVDSPDDSNRVVDNYVFFEFVSIPYNFDITKYLSLRENAGIFKNKFLNRSMISMIMTSIKNSPVASFMNNHNKDMIMSCLFVLHILQDLNLIIKSIDNPIRRSDSSDSYKDFIGQCEEKFVSDGRDLIFLRGQPFRYISMVIINVNGILQQNILDEVNEISKQYEISENEDQKQLEEMLKG